MNPIGCDPLYGASKAAIHHLTRGLNADLLGTPVRATALVPGAVETEFSQVRFKGDTARAAAVYQGWQPLTAGDMADAIHYVLIAPPHVNVQQLTVYPTAPRNPYLLDRPQHP